MNKQKSTARIDWMITLVPLALILPHFIGVWGIYAAEAVSNPLTTIITFAVFERYMGTLKEKMP